MTHRSDPTRRSLAFNNTTQSSAASGSAAGNSAPDLAPIWAERHDFEGTVKLITGLDSNEVIRRLDAECAATRRALADTQRNQARTYANSVEAGAWGFLRHYDYGGDESADESGWSAPLVFRNCKFVMDLAHEVFLARRITSAAPEDVIRSDAEFWLSQYYHFLRWVAYGRRVYLLDRNTAELLLETPLPSFPAADINIPLPAFALALPRDVCAVAIENDPDPQTVDTIHVSVASKPEAPVTLLTLLVAGRSHRGPEDDNAVTGHLAIDGATSISDIAIDKCLSNSYLNSDAVRLLFGFCLYLQSEHPHLVPVKPTIEKAPQTRNKAKLRKAAQRASRRSRLSFIWVGANEDSGGRDDGSVSHADSAGSARLRYAFWVQGHWRKQVCGVGRSERRMRWIKPFRKGPDMAASVHARIGRVQPAAPVEDEST